IIDGLDECNGAHVQNTILNTISNVLQCHRSALPFRFFIASRIEYHLTTSFSVAPLQGLTFRLALNDTFQPDDDIWLYLTDSFCDIRKTHIMRTHLPDSWPSEADIVNLVAKSSGQFIYAATVIRYVSSPRHNPLNRLKVIHGLLPVNNDRPYAQLDALYLNILSDVEDVEAVLRILGVAIVLSNNTGDFVEPLRVYELEEFMQLTPGAVELLLIDVLSVVDASDNNKPIKFLHASFGDFLVDSTRSCQFFINPSKRHEEAAHFCISAIKCKHQLLSYKFISDLWFISYIAFYTLTPVKGYAYRSLLKHLRLAGPLRDNATLREKVYCMPYFNHWRTYAIATRDQHFTYYSSLDDGPEMFLEFLRTSEFRQTEQLYRYHQYSFDQTLRDSLKLIPMSPCLAFWSAVSASRILELMPRVYLRTFAVLSYSSAPDVSAQVPVFLFSASFDCIEVSNGRLVHARYDRDTISGTSYLLMVADFLNDPSRADTHAVDQSTYTTAAVFALEFAVRAWGATKYISGTQYEDSNQWDFVWDAVTFMLSKAGSSPELVSLLGQHNLTFNLGRPSTNVGRRVQTLFGAVHNYVLRFKGSNPSRLKITINWTECPSDYVGNCFTAYDLHNNYSIRRVIYVDESILPSDQNVQEPTGRKRTAMWEYIIRATDLESVITIQPEAAG
ncbi:hypothetical protein CVT25_014587, partial [Psilocybe cyanescens]